MPGKVVRVLVKAGDTVRARQPVVVVEAMKMENELRADRDGTVAEIHVREGKSVDAGALLDRDSVNALQSTPRPKERSATSASCLMLVAAILAAAIVASLTVDLGPAARGAAETQGSKYLERPMRIGRLSIHLLTGKYVVEDLTIDGLRPGDRPFFTAKRIAVALDWATAMRRQPEFLITSVEMTDWQMLVEKWESGHNFPRFTRDDPAAGSAALHDHAQVSARARAASSPTRITRRRGASCAPTSTSRSATCRTTTARRPSPAARCRSRTTCRCGRTCARAS